MNDPRSKNQWPEGKTASEYLLSYSQTLTEAIARIPAESIQAVFDYLQKTLERNGRIYVAGNGGSCAIASHLCCDWMKGIYVEGKPSLRVHSLSESVSLMTALANDSSYDQCFAQQIRMMGDPGDVVVLISSSGNSPNVVEAAIAARDKLMGVISFTGFAGGKLQALSDHNVHISANNYGIVEDGHQMLMHVLGQFLFLHRGLNEGVRKASSIRPTSSRPEVGHT